MELPKNGDCATFVIANAENAFATTALNETVTSVDVVTFVPSSQDIKNKPRFDGVVVVFEMSTAEVQPPVLKVKEGAALLSAANITKTRVIVLAVTLMAEVHFREVVEVLLLLLHINVGVPIAPEAGLTSMQLPSKIKRITIF